MRRIVATLGCLAALAMTLAACEQNPYAPYGWTEVRVVTDNYFPRAIAQGEPDIWCYDTLAADDCYLHPVPGARHRLIEYYGPAPE